MEPMRHLRRVPRRAFQETQPSMHRAPAPALPPPRGTRTNCNPAVDEERTGPWQVWEPQREPRREPPEPAWRPPRELLRVSTAASPPPRTTSPTPSPVSAVLHPALAPACVRKCARVSLCTLLCPGGQGPARTCARADPAASAAGANARRPLAATQRRPSLLHRVSCRLTRAPPLVHAPHRVLRRLRQRAVDVPRCIHRLHGPAR
jgi:hypothetical protein